MKTTLLITTLAAVALPLAANAQSANSATRERPEERRSNVRSGNATEVDVATPDERPDMKRKDQPSAGASAPNPSVTGQTRSAPHSAAAQSASRDSEAARSSDDRSTERPARKSTAPNPSAVGQSRAAPHSAAARSADRDSSVSANTDIDASRTTTDRSRPRVTGEVRTNGDRPAHGSARASSQVTVNTTEVLPRQQVIQVVRTADFESRQQTFTTVHDQVLLVESRIIPVIERRIVTFDTEKRGEIQEALDEWRETRKDLDEALAEARAASASDWAGTRADLAEAYDEYDDATVELITVARARGIELEIEGHVSTDAL